MRKFALFAVGLWLASCGGQDGNSEESEVKSARKSPEPLASTDIGGAQLACNKFETVTEDRFQRVESEININSSNSRALEEIASRIGPCSQRGGDMLCPYDTRLKEIRLKNDSTKFSTVSAFREHLLTLPSSVLLLRQEGVDIETDYTIVEGEVPDEIMVRHFRDTQLFASLESLVGLLCEVGEAERSRQAASTDGGEAESGRASEVEAEEVQTMPPSTSAEDLR